MGKDIRHLEVYKPQHNHQGKSLTGAKVLLARFNKQGEEPVLLQFVKNQFLAKGRLLREKLGKMIISDWSKFSSRLRKLAYIISSGRVSITSRDYNTKSPRSGENFKMVFLVPFQKVVPSLSNLRCRKGSFSRVFGKFWLFSRVFKGFQGCFPIQGFSRVFKGCGHPVYKCFEFRRGMDLLQSSVLVCGSVGGGLPSPPPHILPFVINLAPIVVLWVSGVRNPSGWGPTEDTRNLGIFLKNHVFFSKNLRSSKNFQILQKLVRN